MSWYGDSSDFSGIGFVIVCWAWILGFTLIAGAVYLLARGVYCCCSH